MSLRVAIIADDLTGALDSSVGFAMHGMRTRVAVTADAIGTALADDPEVLAINTASRPLPPEAAAAAVRDAAQQLPARSTLVFKKIDSRLKGNVAVETAAMAAMVRALRIVVAPAVPDQQRLVKDGRVVGRGVAAPIAVAPVFEGLGLPVSVADAETRGDLDALVARGLAADTLFVGASGLAKALARAIGGPLQRYSFQPDGETLFVLGSRDAITRDQIEVLTTTYPELSVAVLPAAGAETALPSRLPALLRPPSELVASPDEVSARLADMAAEAVARLHPATLVLGGGDTALAVLDRLGAKLLAPVGEPILGMVEVTVTVSGRPLRCLVKSGGFGNVDALVGLVESGPVARVAGG